MIADLKPYTGYKESGLPWLGRVPGHWEIKRLKVIARIVMGQSPLSDSCSADPIGVPFLQGCAEFGAIVPKPRQFCSHSPKQAPLGAILLSVRAPVGRLNLANQNYGIGRGLCAILPRQEMLVTRYASHALESGTDSLMAFSTGSTYGAVSVGDVGVQTVPLPPPAEQAAIVRFLDWSNGRLDRAIRAKRKVIALLGEQKQVIIHRAVTRGLDPSVPLKPSGIPWLGDIPQHWRIIRNMALFAHRVEAGVIGLPVLQVSLRSGITLEEHQHGRPKKLIADPTKYKLIYRNDIAYNTMRMWQGAVGVSPSDGLVSPAYVVLRPRDDTCPELYDFVFHTDMYKQQVNRRSTGIVSDRNRLYWDSFKQMPNIAMPRSEQEEIVAFIHSETAGLTIAISRLDREISLLREYRTRLVADVVTGKLDVREAAARLPEEAGDSLIESETDWTDDEAELDPSVSEEAP